MADEVRILSQRTTASTQEIESKIKNLQSGTHNAKEEIQDCSLSMSQTVEQSGIIGNMMNELNALIHQATSMSNQINQAAEEQASTSSTLSNDIQEINDLSISVEKDIATLDTSGQELKQIASKQTEMVAKFTL